ncbi:MAG: NEW3 domain-containing protein [Gemmatimonadales bacterium]
MTGRHVVAALAAIAFHAVAAVAQAPGSGLELRAAANANAQIDGGSVITTVFTVKNLGPVAARVQPAITVPRGWTVVMGSAGFSIAPGASDTWLVGVAVPATAVAATYVVRGALLSNGTTVADSTAVRVNEHRAIEVLSLDVPGWVMAGSRYEARFLVRNRGNVSASIDLAGSTSRGTRVETDPRAAVLTPGAGTTVTVRVAMAQTFARTTDDVLELTAADRADAGVRVVASARTTVVPLNAGQGLATIPAVLSLRSIGGASGVAPVALTGGGTLQDNATLADFFLQSPTGRQSPYGFGERDEYRASFRNDRFTLKLGDNPYGFSQLTSSGMMGTGAQFDGRLGAFSAGAYAQHLRWVPGSVSEAGVMLGTAPDSNRQFFSTFIERQSSGMPVSVGSLGGRVRLSSAASVQLEAAASDSNRANGAATRARLYGSTSRVTYDVGMLHGGTEFAGMARGTTVEDGSFSARIGRQLTVGASGGIRLSDFATPLSGVPAQHYATANVSASYGGVGSIEYGWLSRHDDGALTPVDGTQRGLRATTSLSLGADASVSVSFVRGAVNAPVESAPRAYDVL